MDEREDGTVGYMLPPVKHRFKKGASGNPRGRPRQVKPLVQTNDREIMKRLDAEIVEVDGAPVSKRELELRILQTKALKGDLRAVRLLDQKRTQLKLDQPAPRGGVLRLPMPVSREQWEKDAYESQAKYRDKNWTPFPESDPANKGGQ